MPDIPWQDLHKLVDYLAYEEKDLLDNPDPDHIGHAVRRVREWLETVNRPAP
jgi:hypothetical protein